MNIVRHKYHDDSALASLIPDPVLRQLLFRRGISSARDLDFSLQGLLHYRDLKDIDVAAHEIADAVMQQRRILISGDYDVDGMSGTALGVRCLKQFGLPDHCVSYFVPSRYSDGYGLSRKIVDFAAENGIELIITVDNGIAAVDAAAYAAEKNIRLVVTDHHEIQETLPYAVAAVDPKRADDLFPSKNLCGAAVLFYVMLAVRAELVRRGYYPDRSYAPRLEQFLDLVVLGTVGDVMSFDANNRRLIRAGLRQIREMRCCSGLRALIGFLKMDPAKISVRSIAFDFCPRFNAATRIRIDDNPAILTLLTDNDEEAKMLVERLDMCNRRRIDHGNVMLRKSLRVIEQELGHASAEISDEQLCEGGDLMFAGNTETDLSVPDNVYGICMFDPSFLTGIVGIAANKLKERYRKACVVFGADVGSGKNFSESVLSRNSDNKDRESGSIIPLLQKEYAKMLSSDCEDPIVGSARSVEGLDMMKVFAYIKSRNPDIFISCGGHAMAAGATIKAKDFAEFKVLFNEGCRVCMSDIGDTVGEQISDGELPDSYLCLSFAKDLEQYGPWGKDYEEPKFDGVFILENAFVVGGSHVRFRLRCCNSMVSVEGIKFRASAAEKSFVLLSGKEIKLRVLYTLSVDRYYQERLQLNIESAEPL